MAGLVSVAIPVPITAPRHLDEVLAAVRRQEVDREVEIVVQTIDAGPSQGAIRNKLMQLARGDHVAMITQDATPASTRWLQSLLEGFEQAPDVAAVFGPHGRTWSAASPSGERPGDRRPATRAHAGGNRRVPPLPGQAHLPLERELLPRALGVGAGPLPRRRLRRGPAPRPRADRGGLRQGVPSGGPRPPLARLFAGPSSSGATSTSSGHCVRCSGACSRGVPPAPRATGRSARPQRSPRRAARRAAHTKCREARCSTRTPPSTRLAVGVRAARVPAARRSRRTPAGAQLGADHALLGRAALASRAQAATRRSSAWSSSSSGAVTPARSTSSIRSAASARPANELREEIVKRFAPVEAPVFKGLDDFTPSDVCFATNWRTAWAAAGPAGLRREALPRAGRRAAVLLGLDRGDLRRGDLPDGLPLYRCPHVVDGRRPPEPVRPRDPPLRVRDGPRPLQLRGRGRARAGLDRRLRAAQHRAPGGRPRAGRADGALRAPARHTRRPLRVQVEAECAVPVRERGRAAAARAGSALPARVRRTSCSR